MKDVAAVMGMFAVVAYSATCVQGVANAFKVKFPKWLSSRNVLGICATIFFKLHMVMFLGIYISPNMWDYCTGAISGLPMFMLGVTSFKWKINESLKKAKPLKKDLILGKWKVNKNISSWRALHKVTYLMPTLIMVHIWAKSTWSSPMTISSSAISIALLFGGTIFSNSKSFKMASS